MAQDLQDTAAVSISKSKTGTPAAWRRGVWPAAVILAAYWGACGLAKTLELPFFYRFLFGMAAPLLFLIAFSIWWWTRAGLTRSERIVGYLLVIVGTVMVSPLTHVSLGVAQMLMMGLPLSMTTVMLWVLLAQHKLMSLPSRRLGAVAVLALTCGVMTLLRMEGLDGDLHASFHLRWSPTAEEMFLTIQPMAADPNVPEETAAAITLEQGDWPRFRGPNLDGVVPHVVLAADWDTNPPRQLWKQRIGPAWSSMAIIGERLFTQEQRGEQEAVVCYDAGTGKQLWIHEDAARFWESVSGAGPRATPTFADGRLYTLGATGILNCLDAATGRRVWSHELQKEAGAKIPQWGTSSSPLVTGGLVVVYGGGEKQENLLAYNTDTGSPAWKATAGTGSYASPQAVTLNGQEQVLILCDDGLVAVDRATGAPLWKGGDAMPGAPRSLQAHVIAGTQVLAGVLNGVGVGLADVAEQQGTWTTTTRWTSTEMKPEFSEMVVHENHAYGFDGALFCCLDLATGKRTWKKGRYGRGQVLLLPEKSQLLVLSESGEVVLVAAQPDRHQELGRFEALSGKTWNHPVIAHGRLWVRNAEEIACYDLGATSASAEN